MTGAPRSASRQGRRFVMLGVLVALVVAACAPVETIPPAATNYCVTTPPVSPSDYQSMFDTLRTQYTEWAASDGSLPVDLGDGRIIWLFGDTIVGRVRADGSIANGWQFTHNSMVLQAPDASGAGTCLTPFMGGPRGAHTEAIADPAPNEWYWPLSGIVTDAAAPGDKQLQLYLMHMRFKQNPGGGFDFDIKSIDVSTYEYTPGGGLDHKSTNVIPLGAHPDYGEATLLPTDPADPYVYAYGHTGKIGSDPAKQYVARIARGDDPSDGSKWEFDDGSTTPPTWVPAALDPTTQLWGPATPVQEMTFDPTGSTCVGDELNAPFSELSVIPYTSLTSGPMYLASGKPLSALGDSAVTWSSLSPTGPWTCVGESVGPATTPPTPLAHDLGATFTYGGHVIMLGGAPMLIWSQNHNPLDPDVIANNQLYKAFYAVPDQHSLP